MLAAIAALTLWQGSRRSPCSRTAGCLLALPAVVGRLAVAACLAGGVGLIPLVLTGAERAARARGPAAGSSPAADDEWEEDEAWEPRA